MPTKKVKKIKNKKFLSFQDIIMSLQKFWGNYGCVILQPYDLEVGADDKDDDDILLPLLNKV